MRIKYIFLACLFLLPFRSYAESVLPADVFAKIQAAANIQPGEVVYVDFWASWCNPCRKSFPWMNAMHQKYQSKGFKVLAINVDKERELADVFLSQISATFPIFYDPAGDLAKAFQLKGMPSSFVINDKGAILVAHKGFFENNVAAYETEIQSFLTR